MIRLRHADEWIGFLVVAAVAAFLGAILQVGVLRDWFRPVSDLRIVLPETGVAGLSVGADVEILGTHAGVIRRVVISPNQQMYAEAEIDDQARASFAGTARGRSAAGTALRVRLMSMSAAGRARSSIGTTR